MHPLEGDFVILFYRLKTGTFPFWCQSIKNENCSGLVHNESRPFNYEIPWNSTNAGWSPFRTTRLKGMTQVIALNPIPNTKGRKQAPVLKILTRHSYSPAHEEPENMETQGREPQRFRVESIACFFVYVTLNHHENRCLLLYFALKTRKKQLDRMCRARPSNLIQSNHMPLYTSKFQV